jgi:4-hydroxysphinganine ceramide fatty acyl 2-hydroxylase
MFKDSGSITFVAGKFKNYMF